MFILRNLNRVAYLNIVTLFDQSEGQIVEYLCGSSPDRNSIHRITKKEAQIRSHKSLSPILV